MGYVCQWVHKAVAASYEIDAPKICDALVSGGMAGAEKAILTFMIGAAPEDLT